MVSGTETPEQADLLANCANMTFTTLNFLGGVDFIPGIGDITNVYGFTSNDQVYNAIRQFSGEEVSSQSRYAIENNNRQISAIGARLNSIRQGARAASGVTMSLQGQDLMARRNGSWMDETAPLVGGSAGSADGADLGFGWFANFEYGFGDRKSTDNENKFDFDGWEVFFGGDYAWANGWVAGAAVSYNDNTIDFDDEGSGVPSVSGGDLKADGYNITGFFQYSASNPLYVNGVLSWGQLDYKLSRNVFFEASTEDVSPDRVMKSKTEGNQYEGEVNVGYILGNGPWTFDLSVGVNALKVKVDAFEEDDTTTGGGLNLAFDKQEIDSVQSIVGGVVRRSFPTDTAVVTPYLSLQWRHEFENKARLVDVRYAEALEPTDGRTDNFFMPTDDPDKDYGKVALGISAQMQNSLFFFFQWESVVGLKNTNAHLLTAGLRGVF